MKINIKAIIITVFLILAVVFMGVCIFGSINSQNQNYKYSTKNKIEPPFSNISQGKSLPGTWEYKGKEMTCIIAFNSDETCEVYIDSSWKNFIDMNIMTLSPGSYNIHDNQLEVNWSVSITPNVLLKDKHLEYKYTIQGDQLTLENDTGKYILDRIS